MKKIIEDIITEVDNELQDINIEGKSVLNKITYAINLLETAFDKIKILVLNYEFMNITEEIKFFKEIKPRLFSKLIYYNKIYCFELKRSKGSLSTQKEYIVNTQENLKSFFERNMEFILYYRSGSTILDEFYFLRGKPDLNLTPDSFYFERDPKFSTCYDFKVAKILAYDMFSTYLNIECQKLETINNYPEVYISLKTKETWTDSKSALIELLYAIQTAGSLNQGNIDIKRLAAYFEQIFNIELGDVYRGYLEIRARKGNRTQYIDKLKENLIKRMNMVDNK